MRALAIVLAVIATPAAGEIRPEYTGKVEGSLLGAPSTFDPAAAIAHADVVIGELVFDTLYRLEADGTPIPHVAAGPPEMIDTTHARIAIKKGVKFHDGSPLTPGDVAASIERARRGAGRWALAAIAKVAATPDGVEIALDTPLDVGTMLALPPSAVTRGGRAPGARIVGSGPYQVASVDRAKGRIVLTAFDEHFAGRPYLERLVLSWYDNPNSEARRFELDETQLSARGPAQFFGGQPKFRANAVDGPKALLLFVGFGTKHRDVTRDIAFRRALDLAIDRNALTALNKGEAVVPAGEPIPVEAGGAPPAPRVRSGDLARARLELANAATRVAALRSGNLANLTLEIAFESTRPDDRDLAERVAYALSRLGIGATLAPVSAPELRERATRGSTDLWIGQVAAPLKAHTAWWWWTAVFAIAGDDWAAARLEAGALANQAAERQFLAKRPVLPLMFRGVRMWHRSDLRGLRFDAMGRPCLADLFVFGLPVKSGPGRP